jgi:N-acetylglutamate synthase-like GNAT family acetyltransferase
MTLKRITHLGEVYESMCWDRNEDVDLSRLMLSKLTPVLPMVTGEGQPIKAFSIHEHDSFIGYIEINEVVHEPKLYIRLLVIKPSHRGKGYGRKAIELLIKECQEAKIPKLELETRKKSTGFWLKLGFVFCPNKTPKPKMMKIL